MMFVLHVYLEFFFVYLRPQPQATCLAECGMQYTIDILVFTAQQLSPLVEPFT